MLFKAFGKDIVAKLFDINFGRSYSTYCCFGFKQQACKSKYRNYVMVKITFDTLLNLCHFETVVGVKNLRFYWKLLKHWGFVYSLGLDAPEESLRIINFPQGYRSDFVEKIEQHFNHKTDFS